MESVFLASEADAIPELRRYVVSDGRSVAMEATLDDAIAQFSGTRRTQTPRITDLPTPGGGEQWSARALQLLNSAQNRLREGDFGGFGTALKELRELLEQANRPVSPAG
jgi:uncharacterized membrane protein (UPF0182 family)